MSYNSFGWKQSGTAFLLGHRIQLADGTAFVNQKVEGPALERQAFLGISPKASHDRHWPAVVNRMFGGAAGQGMFVVAAAAAPMIALHSKRTRSILITLRGPKKSGRSTAELAAATLWGRQQSVILHTLGQFAEDSRIFGGLPMIIPDIEQRDQLLIAKALSQENGHCAVMMATCSEDYEPPVPEGSVHINLTTTKINSPMKPLEARARLLSSAGMIGSRFIGYVLQEPACSLYRRLLHSWEKDFEPTHRGHVLAHLCVTAHFLREMRAIDVAQASITAWCSRLSSLPGGISPGLSSPGSPYPATPKADPRLSVSRRSRPPVPASSKPEPQPGS